jgi:3-deoxy-D-manno-octulosonic-acid transferase
VGEVKAAFVLYPHLQAKYPGYRFFVTTTTRTGLEEAARLFQGLPMALLPLDFSWIAKRWSQVIRPSLFVLVESGFCPNWLHFLKKQGTYVVLVNGKVSSRSSQRYDLCPFLFRSMWEAIDCYGVQNQIYRDRFLSMGISSDKMHITGNLKLVQTPQTIASQWKQERPVLQAYDITMASTHSPEEELLLQQLLPLGCKIFIAPRHPERFAEVEVLLDKLKVPFMKWTDPSTWCSEKKVCLVDAMGQLPYCYALTPVAIVGGSFCPHLQGHNVVEPTLYGAYALFGAYMDSQQDLVEHVKMYQLGETTSLSTVASRVVTLLQAKVAGNRREQWDIPLQQAVVGKTLACFPPSIGSCQLD